MDGATVYVARWEAVLQNFNHLFVLRGDCDEFPLAYVKITWQGHPSVHEIGCPACYDLIKNVQQVGRVHWAAHPWQNTVTVNYIDIPDVTAKGGVSP